MKCEDCYGCNGHANCQNHCKCHKGWVEDDE